MEITDEQLGEMGKAADSLDNLISAAAMPLPLAQKLQYTLDTIRELSARLKAVYMDVSGDNPWEV